MAEASTYQAIEGEEVKIEVDEVSPAQDVDGEPNGQDTKEESEGPEEIASETIYIQNLNDRIKMPCLCSIGQTITEYTS